ncbi:MAG: hypothetical protein R3C03_00375 [Pirellulaceae bacterium]
MKFARKQIYLAAIVALMIPVVASTGCIGAMAQLMYVIRGHKTKAAYDGLEGKTVAVVCVSDAEAYGPDTLKYTVSKIVSLKLSQSVKKIKVVPPSKIEDWIDTNGWDQMDFTEIGRGVNADMVVAIEIAGYTIHDGATLYKGQSDLTVSVYDMKRDGQVQFVKGPENYVFPTNGRPAIQSTDRQFEAVYLAKLNDHISKLFYDHDALDDVAEDASMMF